LKFRKSCSKLLNSGKALETPEDRQSIKLSSSCTLISSTCDSIPSRLLSHAGESLKKAKKPTEPTKEAKKVVHTNILEILTFYAIDLPERRGKKGGERNFYIMWRRFVVFFGPYVSKIKNEIGNCEAGKSEAKPFGLFSHVMSSGRRSCRCSRLVLIANSTRKIF
jgi:hypothetical protein